MKGKEQWDETKKDSLEFWDPNGEETPGEATRIWRLFWEFLLGSHVLQQDNETPGNWEFRHIFGNSRWDLTCSSGITMKLQEIRNLDTFWEFPLGIIIQQDNEQEFGHFFGNSQWALTCSSGMTRKEFRHILGIPIGLSPAPAG